jgi:hypothetical protein
LLLVGSIEISDYLDLIVRSLMPWASGGLLDFLGSSPVVRGLLPDWYNIPESSPTLSALKAVAGERGWMYGMEVFRPTPQIALGGDFEAYLAGLEKKQRHEIKRKMRRAAEGPSPARSEPLSTLPLAGRDWRFLELMAQDAESSASQSQHDGAHAPDAPDVGARLFVVGVPDLGGSRIAAALNFDYGNRLWGYNSAVSRDFHSLAWLGTSWARAPVGQTTSARPSTYAR